MPAEFRRPARFKGGGADWLHGASGGHPLFADNAGPATGRPETGG